MSDVTQILSAIDQGDPHAAEQLLPWVYAELRKLAAQKLAHEKPGHTLDATALVHEAYLRLATPPSRITPLSRWAPFPRRGGSLLHADYHFLEQLGEGGMGVMWMAKSEGSKDYPDSTSFSA
jgi:hypothetical protein